MFKFIFSLWGFAQLSRYTVKLWIYHLEKYLTSYVHALKLQFNILDVPNFSFLFFWLFLQDNSKWRRHYLNSLYEYMQGSNKELVFLGEEQQKIKRQDWSDRMIDPPDVRRQYEVRI